MSERELGKALLRGEDPMDIAALTERVLRRDRRRVGALSVVCFLAWMMVVMLPWSIVMPAMAKFGALVNIMPIPTTQTVELSRQQRDTLQVLPAVLRGATIVTFLASVGSMFVAAMCTVLLIVVSRRATLRQLNARLGEISAQLKKLAGDGK